MGVKMVLYLCNSIELNNSRVPGGMGILEDDAIGKTGLKLVVFYP